MDETKRKFESQRYVWCELFVLGVLKAFKTPKTSSFARSPRGIFFTSFCLMIDDEEGKKGMDE